MASLPASWRRLGCAIMRSFEYTSDADLFPMSISLHTLQTTLDKLLRPDAVQDYCPNGLQVEGSSSINKLVTGVTASQALIDAAVTAEADAILVHHGYFWRGEDPCIRGIKKQRIDSLLRNEISLFAYHLPLDVHPELGNNVQLAKRLGITVKGDIYRQGNEALVFVGELKPARLAGEFLHTVQETLAREPLLIGSEDTMIRRIAWCTGAAQGYIEQAIEAGVDAYLSGEISEQTVHAAREGSVAYIAAGHHATERYGVQAVGEYLQTELGIEHQFIDIDNPA